jgi:hypothetical protein
MHSKMNRYGEPGAATFFKIHYICQSFCCTHERCIKSLTHYPHEKPAVGTTEFGW